MIGSTISRRSLNALLRIQNLHFTNVPWSNTPRMHFTILNTLYLKARKHASTQAHQVDTA